MAASAPKSPAAVKSIAMPVDAAVFAGTPSVTGLASLPAQGVLLAAAMDRRIVSCDLRAEPPPKGAAARHTAWAHANWAHDLDVHPDGVRVATGGADKEIRIWRWGQDKPLATVRAHDDCVRVVAFSRDGRLLASAGDDGLVRLWDANTAAAVATLNAGTQHLDALAWSADSRRLHAAGIDGKIFVWDVARKQLASTIDVDNRRLIEDEPLNGGFSYPGGVRGLATSPDGTKLAAVGLTSLVVLDTATGREVLRQDGRGFGVAFDPSGRRLAWSQEMDLVVWDFTLGAISHRIKANQLGLFALCFLDGGKHLASGGSNGVIGLWDLSA